MNNRNPIDGSIIIPPFGIPFKPGQGPMYPPGYFPPVKNLKDKIIKIKSVVEDEFVIVEDDGYLYATGEKSNQNGVFKLIMLEGSRVKIRQDGGRFIRVDRDDFLVADANKEDATIFNLYKIDNKEYVLRAPNRYYVRVRDKDKALVARAENTGPRTIFKFKEVDKDND